MTELTFDTEIYLSSGLAYKTQFLSEAKSKSGPYHLTLSKSALTQPFTVKNIKTYLNLNSQIDQYTLFVDLKRQDQ